MAEKSKKKESSKVEKRSKKGSKEEKVSKEKKQKAAVSAFSLLADDKTVDPTLSSLFAVKQPAVKAKPVEIEPRKSTIKSEVEDEEEDNDAELSELDEELDEDDANISDAANEDDAPQPEAVIKAEQLDEDAEAMKPKRKRKRNNGEDEIEDAYMSRLVREGEKENARLAAERAAKRQKQEDDEDATAGDEAQVDAEDAPAKVEDEDDEDEVDEDAMSPPPKHETEVQADQDVEKANRTVFLGNVSTDAITSKSSLKTLKTHLSSFFSDLKDTSTHRLESIRFRSTPYASAIPKKAAYAKKELMDATTKSTNAYAVYSSPLLAREASKRLNGTIVLNRHLRVDEVAHPAKVDHRRCIFVGNLGFVDDESNIQDANEEEGREKRKRGKEPADVEEGLWRTFSKCGKVESVRVIRDSTTRVGKGIAYVQFEDENAVEAALLYNEKKFPPMLPRKLRVSRAKAQKRNAKPGSGRPGVSKPSANGYQRKLTGEEASKLGRTGKLLGRAAAANVRRNDKSRPPRERSTGANATALGEAGGIQKPESFIFEGHRATAKSGKSGLKLGGKHAKKSGGSKVTKRSASFKAKKRAS